MMAAAWTTVLAQDALEPATFRTGVASVRVDAQVSEGPRVLGGLTQSDFLIYDNNARQEISYFGWEREPVTLLLVLDVSGSMNRYLEQIAAASREALKNLKPGDQVGIQVFARNSKVSLEFTSERGEISQHIKNAIGDRDLGSGTQINFALIDAAKYFTEKAPATGRRAVLILTDNLGVNYQSPDVAAIRALQDANIVCNAIVVGKARRPDRESRFKNPDFTLPNVFTIAEETGGDVVKSNEAGQAFAEILDRMRSRYSIHYSSPGGAIGSYREIRVELSPLAKMKYPSGIVRYRKGYYVR